MAHFEFGARELRESGPSSKADQNAHYKRPAGQGKKGGEIDIQEDLQLDDQGEVQPMINYRANDDDVILDAEDQEGYDEFDDIDI